jgi:hypothetical protein
MTRPSTDLNDLALVRVFRTHRETVKTSRSDHYGVLVTVEGPKP